MKKIGCDINTGKAIQSLSPVPVLVCKVLQMQRLFIQFYLYISLASFPDLCTVQFLVAYSMDTINN